MTKTGFATDSIFPKWFYFALNNFRNYVSANIVYQIGVHMFYSFENNFDAIVIIASSLSCIVSSPMSERAELREMSGEAFYKTGKKSQIGLQWENVWLAFSLWYYQYRKRDHEAQFANGFPL